MVQGACQKEPPAPFRFWQVNVSSAAILFRRCNVEACQIQPVSKKSLRLFQCLVTQDQAIKFAWVFSSILSLSSLSEIECMNDVNLFYLTTHGYIRYTGVWYISTQPVFIFWV